jgi:anaerobic selenocysteine-containing dehydrogenase
MGNKDIPTTWEEDDYIITRTTAWSAPGCHEGCGVVCYVKDGKLVKVEGDKLHPYNQGRICPRCAALPDVVNSPDRLLYPMKRDPSKRGDPDAWERVTWDEALDLIESTMKGFADEFGSWTLQVFNGTGRDVLWEAQRLAYSMGTPHVESYASGLACWMPRLVAYILTTGGYMMPDCSQRHEDRYDHEGYQYPEVLISWGSNSVQSNSDGFYGAWLVECLKQGTKLISIDPRMTWLCARSDIWIQPRPAVDSAIALAMLKTIIEEDLYDHDFVDCWTFGFDELAERCAEYDTEKLAEVAWVDADQLRAAARMFAKADRAGIQLGLALDMQRHGIAGVQAIICMMAITGNIDKPGGQIFTPDPYGVNNFGWGWEELSQEAQEKLIGYDEYPLIRMGMRLDQPDLTVVMAEKEDPYAFKGAIMLGTNPLNCMSNADLSRVYNVLMKLEFIVVADWTITPTIQALADVALPVAMYMERQGVRYMYTGLSVLQPIAGLDIQGEPKGDEEISWLLGKRFNPEMYPWPTVEGMLDTVLAPSGSTWKNLQEQHWLYEPMNYYRYEKGELRHDGRIGFNTATQRIELYSSMAESMGYDPLPYYAEPYYGPLTTPELYAEYPIITMTGTRNIQFFHSEHRNIAKLREIQPDPLVEVNDVWAKEQGFRDGDWLWIENKVGRIKHRAKLTPTVKAGMANINSGWWFPEMDPHDDPMYGCWDVNPNVLSELGQQGPTGFGADVKALLCKIYKCEEGEY